MKHNPNQVFMVLFCRMLDQGSKVMSKCAFLNYCPFVGPSIGPGEQVSQSENCASTVSKWYKLLLGQNMMAWNPKPVSELVELKAFCFNGLGMAQAAPSSKT